MKESSVSGSDSDCAETYCDACNCDHEMDHTPQNIDSRVMMLKLKKARLETRVAYSRTRLLLAEMELRMAERQLHLEAKNASPAHTPKRPQRKRPHKLVKLLNRVFKASNQNTEEHTTVTLEVKDAKKKNVEETEKRNKIKKSTDDSQDRENRNNSRINTQENIQEITDLSKKSSKDKSKNTSDEKKKTETKIKEKKSTENNKGDKKHKTSKDSKTKHSKRHKQENSKEKDNNNGKVDKELKSILKKTSITEETNNNIPANITSDVRVFNEDSVEYNVRNTFCSSGLFNNSCIYQMDTTNVDKALVTIGEIDESIFIKRKVTAPILKGIAEDVDAMESQNDQLFKELRGNDASHVASSIGSMETLVLDEDSEDGKF